MQSGLTCGPINLQQIILLFIDIDTTAWSNTDYQNSVMTGDGRVNRRKEIDPLILALVVYFEVPHELFIPCRERKSPTCRLGLQVL
jgi:hypothetical protein